jgi:hypothetical protein
MNGNQDIAVLKIDAPVFDLYPIDVGTSSNLRPGQSAYAIGNPFGLDHSKHSNHFFRCTITTAPVGYFLVVNVFLIPFFFFAY